MFFRSLRWVLCAHFLLMLAAVHGADSTATTAIATEASVTILWGSAPGAGSIELHGGTLRALRAGDQALPDASFDLTATTTPRLALDLAELQLAPGPGASRVTVRNGARSFTFFVRDVRSDFPICIPEYDVVVTTAEDRRDYAAIRAAIQAREGRTLLEQYEAEPEPSWDAAAAVSRTMSLPIWLGVSRDSRMFELETQNNYTMPEYLKSDRIGARFFSEERQGFVFMLGRGVNVAETMQRHIDGGRLPILHGTRLQEGMEYQLTAFATLESSPLTTTSLRGTDYLVADYQVGGNSRDALTTDQLKRAESLLAQETSPALEQTVLYFRARAHNTTSAPQYAYFLVPNPNTGLDATQGYYLSGDNVAVVATLNGRPLPNEELSILLAPGETVTLDCRIPHQPISVERARALGTQDFEQRLDECRRFWTSKLESGTRVHLPEQRIDEMLHAGLLHLDLICFGREPNEPLGAATGYAPIGTESSPIIQFLDTMGWHREAERAIDYFIAKQHPDGFMQNYGSYQGEVGPVLWTIGEHWRYTRDEAWARRIKAAALKSCDYLIRKRAESNDLPQGRGRGMIRGKIGDPEDPYHSFALNGYSCLGLARMAEMLATIDPVESARLQREVDSFREDIRASYAEAVAEAPVVPLGDGSWAPNPPPWVGPAGALVMYAEPAQRHYFTHGSTTVRDSLLGPIYLPFTEILGTTETSARWLARVHSEMYGIRNAVPTQPYYSRHDWLQLRQGYVHAFLQTYYNTAAGYFDHQTHTVKEHPYGGTVHKTHEESWFLLQTRWMLWMEDGDCLRLLSGIPRAWMQPGKQITLDRAASYFGPFSLQATASADGRQLTARITCTTDRAPREVVIRLPHPERRKPSRIAGGTYDAATESVRIAPFMGSADVTLTFE